GWIFIMRQRCDQLSFAPKDIHTAKRICAAATVGQNSVPLDGGFRVIPQDAAGLNRHGGELCRLARVILSDRRMPLAYVDRACEIGVRREEGHNTVEVPRNRSRPILARNLLDCLHHSLPPGVPSSRAALVSFVLSGSHARKWTIYILAPFVAVEQQNR